MTLSPHDAYSSNPHADPQPSDLEAHQDESAAKRVGMAAVTAIVASRAAAARAASAAQTPNTLPAEAAGSYKNLGEITLATEI